MTTMEKKYQLMANNADKASVATTEWTEHQARCGKRTQDAKQQSKD